eukprot:TRINITY_DN4514_c0_g1_i3.p1 TRINITY_DN4514_c0_g1~~TRINITY_DN4514_c0_g1_i3.p1  ORF type:complete len:278 (+),score=-9.09 TRINITY_DN4514_c0_g1_i3:77-835(+)
MIIYPVCDQSGSLPSSETRNTLVILQSDRKQFNVYQGTVESPGIELYKAIDKTDCSCVRHPGYLEIYQSEKLVGSMEYTGSQSGCDHITAHKVSTIAGEGETPVSEILIDFSRCRTEIAVKAVPFFASSPTRLNFFPWVLALIFTIILSVVTAGAVAKFSGIAAVAIVGLTIVLCMTELVVMCYKRGAVCWNAKRWKLLELFNEGSVVATMYKARNILLITLNHSTVKSVALHLIQANMKQCCMKRWNLIKH